MKKVLMSAFVIFALGVTQSSFAVDLDKIGKKIKKAAKKASKNKTVKKIVKDKVNKPEQFKGTGTKRVSGKRRVRDFRAQHPGQTLRDACFDDACDVAYDDALDKCEEEFGAENCEPDGQCKEVSYSDRGRKASKIKEFSCTAHFHARGSKGYIE